MKPTFYNRQYDFGNTSLKLGSRTLIMGILNVTPDSFSDGGQFNDIERAVERAIQLYQEGADLIDIGGESTRPGHAPVSLEEELSRVIPIIKAIHQAAPHIPLSIDTYKAETARQALEAGAHVINDIWGAKLDPLMASVAAEYGCPIVLMHNRKDRDYNDIVEDIILDLQESIDLALVAGVAPERIILDPGIGFAKEYADNLKVMQALDRINALGYPLLLATSRKKFIRTILDLPANDVVEGTAATVALGIAQGCQIVRVHDVSAMKRTVDVCDAIVYGDHWEGRHTNG
ncbi:dihydropteroate synthase [Paenibacillus shirakamiensis]|uniref:Dihydropteroate synthase n=1 Tax=Paenibacillus shirakamiensis TaxID=1265935 RepID=A0ABS4JM03_9BACL|nr:dihydropteroate synthase [Paenibacillus shirakamiensis]MBP2002730.1 dihydropteroate synthase [Paenibacillus shirakamiensis]